MKHIKLFEDYSEEEIEGLLGDLEGIGHKSQLFKGKDFGFRQNLKGENNGVNHLYFTSGGMSFLAENGIVGKDLEINKDYMGFIKGQVWDRRVHGKFEIQKKEISGFDGYIVTLETRSGKEQKWPATWNQERFRRPSIIRILNEFISKIEKIRK